MHEGTKVVLLYLKNETLFFYGGEEFVSLVKLRLSRLHLHSQIDIARMDRIVGPFKSIYLSI
jgi:hypothetical protein